MDFVRHERPGEALCPAPAQGHLDPAQERLAHVIVSEQPAPIPAAHPHVVHGAFDIQSRFARHGAYCRARIENTKQKYNELDD